MNVAFKARRPDSVIRSAPCPPIDHVRSDWVGRIGVFVLFITLVISIALLSAVIGGV